MAKCSHCGTFTRAALKAGWEFLKTAAKTHIHHVLPLSWPSLPILGWVGRLLCPGGCLFWLGPWNLWPSLWPSKQNWLLFGSVLVQMLYVAEAVVQRWRILISVRVTAYDSFSPASPTLLSVLAYVSSFQQNNSRLQINIFVKEGILVVYNEISSIKSLFSCSANFIFICIFFFPWQLKASQRSYCSGFQRAIVYLCGYK